MIGSKASSSQHSSALVPKWKKPNTEPYCGCGTGYTNMQTTNSNMAQCEVDDESLIRALDNQAAPH